MKISSYRLSSFVLAALLATSLSTGIAVARSDDSMAGMDMLKVSATPTPKISPSKPPIPMAGMDMGGAMPGRSMSGSMMAMQAVTDVAQPMSRESSGTSWVPDSTPMYMKMKMHGRDSTMFHFSAFPRYTTAQSDRDVSAAGKGGNSRFDAPTMFMGMYSHPLDSKPQLRSQIGVRLMLSADPLIERGYGYPLLYQSGESYRGQQLHDRQHPHDLFSELSTTYSRRVGEKQSAYLYLGYPGEPALGPPTFMHRLSGMDNPNAPLSHHWMDSTHITFGVMTAGYSFGKWKVESSAFNGSEPDENRYNFDSPNINSYSGRLSWNPTDDLAMQVSYGYLKHPEALETGNQNRTTASLIYNKPMGDDANWSNSLVFGRNVDDPGTSNAYLFESALQKGENTYFTRLEHVQKSGEELVLAPADQTKFFGVNGLTVGYVRDIQRGKGLNVGVGFAATLNTNPSGLDSYYGGGSHGAYQLFLRIRPSRMKMDEMTMSGK